MAIDLPPTLPPVQATEVQVKNYASSPASAITANINDIQLKVFGDTYLGNDEIVQLIESSKTPSDAIMLYSTHVPTDGGDTMVANTQLAYDGLSNDMKRRIAGLVGIHRPVRGGGVLWSVVPVPHGRRRR